MVGSVAALANELVPMDRDGCMVGGYMATMTPFFLRSCSRRVRSFRERFRGTVGR